MATPAYYPSLEKVQVGLETAWGDLAVPTVQLVGIEDCKITPRVESTQIKDKRGTTMPAYAAAATVNRIWAEAQVSGVVNYSHLRHWLDAMFGIDATDVYNYIAELDPTTAIRSFNLLQGQPDVSYSMGGAVLDKLNLVGSNNGPMMFNAHLLGKGSVTDILEALTDDTVVWAMGHHLALWIDPIGGTVGSTAVATTAFNFNANIEVDRKLVWHLGDLNPSGFRHGKWGGSLSLSLEMTSDMQAILDEIIHEEIEPHGYLVRIRATDALTTSIFTLDFSGHALVPPTLFTDDDGVTTVELELVPAFTDDVTFLSCWKASLDLP